MEQGFIGDSFRHARSVLAPVWYSGPLAWSFFGTLKLRKRRSIFVQTMRCTACGYLESYAPEPAPQR